MPVKNTKCHPDRTRRLIVQGIVATVASGLGVGARMRGAHADAAADVAKWPKDAFTQKTEADAIKALYGRDTEPSDKIKLEAPEIAENGAVVPISVSSALPDVTSIAILVSENPFPLAAAYPIPAGTPAIVSNRLKMAKTSNVTALIESGGKIYSASKQVKVTVGGCGG
jgi:sulfur-oxidizing protein SoxY